MSSFFSQKNVQYVQQLCTQFMSEKYNIQVPETDIGTILKTAMAEVYEHFRENPPMPGIEDLNKRSIVRAKEQILLLVRENMPKPPPPPPPMDAPPEENQQDIFMQKLQQLELMRSAAIAPPPVATKPEPVLATTVPPAPAPPPSQTVLYIPTHAMTRSSKSFVVSSGTRMWAYFHDRHTFDTSGPLPSTEISSQLRLSSVQLPTSASERTSVVNIRVQGAGGQACVIPCVIGALGRSWDTWQPVSRESSIMASMAMPWTIQVVDGTCDEAIDLGKDGIVVKNVATTSKGTLSVTLADCPDIDRLKGKTLLVRHPSDEITKHRVISVGFREEIEVSQGSIAIASGCLCAVQEEQISLVFELYTSEKNDSRLGGK